MEKISNCASKANRTVNQIKLVVVTKNQPAEKIIEVIEAGALYLGENYPEETIEKWKQIGNCCDEFYTNSLDWSLTKPKNSNDIKSI